MKPDNPYLRGVRVARSGRRWFRFVMLLALGALAFYALFELLDPGNGEPVDPALYLGALFVLVFAVAIGVVVGRRRRAGAPRAADARVRAEALLLRDDFDAAVPAIHEAIGRARGAWRRANLLMLLGRCAEGRGDFAEAADVYGCAERLLPSRRTVPYAQLAPILAARAAFALAASGRLEQAVEALARSNGRDAYPGTRALAARARAVVFSRRGEHEALCKHVDESRVIIKNSLSYRDRMLLRVVAANAHRALAGGLRGGVPAGLHLDAETRRWIGRATPEVMPFLDEVA